MPDRHNTNRVRHTNFVKPVYFCARVNYNFAERKVSRSNYGV